jgi:hypothetical protein
MNETPFQNTLVGRLNAQSQFNQNCLFTYKGRVFDSERLIRDVLLMTEDEAYVVLTIQNEPILIEKEFIADFRERVKQTWRSALVRYHLAYKAAG